VKYVKLGNDIIEVVQEFCYFGGDVGSCGVIQSSVMARIHAGWRKFSELSQVLCGRVLSLKLKGGGSGTTRPLPRDGGVEKLHRDPTVRPRPKVWTRGQKWKK